MTNVGQSCYTPQAVGHSSAAFAAFRDPTFPVRFLSAPDFRANLSMTRLPGAPRMKLDPNSTDKCRVLIVDDDQKVRALLNELLEADAYEVMCATMAAPRACLTTLS